MPRPNCYRIRESDGSVVYEFVEHPMPVREMEPELFTAEQYRQEAMRVRRAGMAMRDEWVRQGMGLGRGSI